MERKHVLKIRDGMADRPAAANNMVKALRQVFNYGVEYNIHGLQLNPLRDIKNLKSKNPDGFHSWSLEEIAKFEAKHPIGSKARLAMSLLLYTGQRRSDIVVLGRQHVKKGRLEFTQIKNINSKPTHMSIPILPELQRIIDASPCGDLTFLVTEFGKPYSNDGFGNWFRRMCKSAGLIDCSAHGLRKAAAAWLAETGCTDHEIMAITGHRTQKEVKRYTEAARQKVLADNAIFKIQRDIDRTKMSYSTDGYTKVRQKEGKN
jgi:integrase